MQINSIYIYYTPPICIHYIHVTYTIYDISINKNIYIYIYIYLKPTHALNLFSNQAWRGLARPRQGSPGMVRHGKACSWQVFARLGQGLPGHVWPCQAWCGQAMSSHTKPGLALPWPGQAWPSQRQAKRYLQKGKCRIALHMNKPMPTILIHI